MLSKRSTSVAVTSSTISSRMLPGMLFLADSAECDPKLHSVVPSCITVYRWRCA